MVKEQAFAQDGKAFLSLTNETQREVWIDGLNLFSAPHHSADLLSASVKLNPGQTRLFDLTVRLQEELGGERSESEPFRIHLVLRNGPQQAPSGYITKLGNGRFERFERTSGG